MTLQTRAGPYLQEAMCLLFFAHGNHGLAHLIALLLAPLVRAQSFLCELQRAFDGSSGAYLQQLDHAPLVGREASDLTDHLLHELVAWTVAALAVGRLLWEGAACHDEALVRACGKARCSWLSVTILRHGVEN